MGLFALDVTVAWQEVIEKRTTRGRTYFDADTGQYRVVSGMVALQDESGSEIDATPVRFIEFGWDGWRVDLGDWTYGVGKVPGHASDGWMVFAQGPHNLKTRLARVGYLHWPTRAWQDVGGNPTYDRNNISATPSTITVGPNDDEVTVGTDAVWENIWQTPDGGALDIHWRINGDRIKEEIVIDETAVDWIKTNRPPTTPADETWFGFIFEVDADAVPQVVIDGIVSQLQDEAPEEPIELRDAVGTVIATLPLDRGWSTGDPQQVIDLQKRIYTENGNVYLLVGARVDLLAGLPAGDVVFDPTINVGVSASGDDGFWSERSGGAKQFSDNNTFLWAGELESSGIRIIRGLFVVIRTLGLPPTSDLDQAVIEFENNNTSNANIDLELRLYDVDSATAPTTYSAARNATLTTASTAIQSNLSSTNPITFDFTSALDEVKSRIGFTDTSNIAIDIRGLITDPANVPAGTDQELRVDSERSTAPSVSITYTIPNTAPEIADVSTTYPTGFTRIGPESGNATIKFTATDAEQTSTDDLSWEIRTASGGGGTLVASGNCTSGIEESVSIAYNASGLSQGSNTLYILVGDGTDTDEAFTTVLVDSSTPTVGTITQSPNPTTDHDYALSFTANDTYSTDTNELSWQIRTAASGGGTLLDNGTATSGVAVNTGTITDSGLAHGTNTRWLRILDGAGNVLDQSFDVEVNLATMFSVAFDGASTFDVTLTSPTHFTTALDGTSDLDVELISPTVFDVDLAGESALDVALTSVTEFEVAFEGVSDLLVELVNFQVSDWHKPPLFVRTLTSPTRARTVGQQTPLLARTITKPTQARTLNIGPTQARTLVTGASADLGDVED